MTMEEFWETGAFQDLWSHSEPKKEEEKKDTEEEKNDTKDTEEEKKSEKKERVPDIPEMNPEWRKLPFIFDLLSLDSMGPYGAFPSTVAINNLSRFVGEKIFPLLNLEKSAITGSALTAACRATSSFREDMISMYPPYYTIPDSKEEYEKFMTTCKNITIAPDGGIVRMIGVDDKSSVKTYTLKFVPASDTDIVVFAEGDEYERIAREHIKVISGVYEGLSVEALHNGSYILTDPNAIMRPIQIYPGTLRTIWTHHTGPVRAWYTHEVIDGDIVGKIYCLASFLRSLITRTIHNYYYFAGQKYPMDVIHKLNERSFHITDRLACDVMCMESRHKRELTGVICYNCDADKYNFYAANPPPSTLPVLPEGERTLVSAEKAPPATEGKIWVPPSCCACKDILRTLNIFSHIRHRPYPQEESRIKTIYYTDGTIIYPRKQ